MAMNRMMQAIPEADVIITNPTHFTVAIKYDQRAMDAQWLLGRSRVVASGLKMLKKRYHAIKKIN